MKQDAQQFRIGILLTEAGIVTVPQLEAACATEKSTGEPFLRVLLLGGLLHHNELQAVVRLQALIWRGATDVDAAVQLLSYVHDHTATLDEALKAVPGINASAQTVSAPMPQPHVPTPVSDIPAVRQTGFRLCRFCGHSLEANESKCSFCTAEMQRPAAQDKLARELKRRNETTARILTAPAQARDPLMMAFFSGAMVPGLGQILIGQKQKGIALVFLAGIGWLVTGGFLNLLVFPLAAIDAYLIADKLKKGKVVGYWEAM